MDTFFKLLKDQNLHDFYYGFKQGIPIALGYIPVSFTFGLMAVSGGIPVWMAIFISLSNLTSAGQFAGTKLIIADAPLLEIALTTFVINIRYMLMSLSLSQRVTPEMPTVKRCIMAFGITDETFTIASLEKRKITFAYMMGLIACPYWGWGLGTALGGIDVFHTTAKVAKFYGYCIYAMFIALIVPVAKKSTVALAVSAIAISISSFFAWMPYMAKVSEGWSIIIATIVASCAGALLFPVEDEYE